VPKLRAHPEKSAICRQDANFGTPQAEATIEALALLRLIMDKATRRVRTPTGIQEEPDWRTQLKACRLVLTMAFASIPELHAGARQGATPDRRTLRIVP